MRLSFLTKTSLAVLLLFSQSIFALQPGSGTPVAQPVEMADQLRADGKIWVVVAVVAAVFTGIIIYLIRLDRQLSKLEKDMNDQKSKVPQKTQTIGS